MDTKFLLSTSKICEHFISVTGYVLGDHEYHVTAFYFEQELFLKVKSNFWSVANVNSL